MKIGILTFHRAHNYGAVLQCYALQEVLKNMGHDVWIIDYRQSYIESIYKPFNIKLGLGLGWFHNPRTKITYISNIKNRIIRKKIFKNFREKYLRETSIVHKADDIANDFDYIFIGSDQLWNKECTGFYDFLYYGYLMKENTKLIGFSISMSEKEINLIDKRFLKASIDNFFKISFRENKVAELIKKLTNSNTINTTLDPTMLLGKSEWEKIINNKWKGENYVAVYKVRGPKLITKEVEKLINDNKLKIIDLSHRTFSPEDFLSIIYHAKYVITSSFHATVFSLLFHKQTIIYKLNDGHDNRVLNLLESLDMKNIAIDMGEEIKHIDYTQFEKNLLSITDFSLSYLDIINHE